MKKRVLSVLLALCMLLVLLPAEAMATNAESGVQVTDFTVTVDNETPISLLTAGSELNLKMGNSYTFRIVFNKPDEVKRAYVVSSKDGEKIYLEATNNGSGIFSTSGFFGNDIGYIPGAISVEYSRSDKNLQEDGNWLSLKSPLGLEKVTISTNESTSVRGRADISDLIKSEVEVGIDFAVDMYDAAAGTDIGTWLDKYASLLDTIENLDKGTFTCIDPDVDLGDPGTYVMFLKDATDSDIYYKVIMKVAGDKAPNLTSVAETLNQSSDVISLMSDYIDIRNEKNDLREQIEASNTISNKTEAYEKLDAYSNDRLWFSMITTILPVAVAATGGTMVIPGLIFTAYLNIINTAADYFWDYRVGLITGSDPIDNVFEDSNDHGAGWTALTKEYLQAHMVEDDFFGGTYFIIDKSGKYYFAEDIDYGPQIVIKNSGTELTEVTICLHGHRSVVYLSVDSGILQIRDCEYKEHDDGSVTGGTVDGRIWTSKRGKVYINSGIVKQGFTDIPVTNEGEVILNGGMLIGYHGISSRDGGKVTINGGSILGERYGIYAEGENEIVINDGVITGSGMAGIWINNGSVTINGGGVSGNPWMIENKPGATSNVITTVTGGSHKGEIENNGGTVLIGGGKIAGTIRNTSGTVTVSSGEISDYDSAIWNLTADGTINVNGGILSGVSDLGSGSAIQNAGGTINISNGEIHGISTNEAVNLRITPTSDIKLFGGLGHTPSIMRVANYAGVITYYNKPDAIGTVKTIEELLQTNWHQPYVRLVADGAIGDIPPALESCTITFNPAGGTVSPLTMPTNEAGKLTELPIPTRTGYTFEGWFTSLDSGEKITASTVFTEDTTVYAHWTNNAIPPVQGTYTITFDANGGMVTPEILNTGEDGRLASLPTPIRNGYSFSGWFTALSGGNRVITSTVFTSDTTVYAGTP